MRHRARWGSAAVVALTVLSTGCGNDDTPNALDPAGDEARDAAAVWWILLGLAALVFVVITGLILLAAVRRAGSNPGRLRDDSFIAIGGVAVPLAILAVVGVVTVVYTARLRPAAGEPTAHVVEVVGHQYWWEVRYPELGIVTANEIHLPVDEPVRFRLSTEDVIHSFWVPQLAGKLDMVPGQVNELVTTPTETGSFWGQCAEFCGLQHAHMALLLVVHDTAGFEDWVTARADDPAGEDTAEPRSGAEDALVARGRAVYLSEPCAGCHRIEGTTSQAQVGPDLSDLGTRRYLGAGVRENTPQNLARWITDLDDVKPGALMPEFDLTADDLEALVAYLGSLDS